MLSVQQRTIFPGGNLKPISITTITADETTISDMLGQFAVANLPGPAKPPVVEKMMLGCIDMLINPPSAAEWEITDHVPFIAMPKSTKRTEASDGGIVEILRGTFRANRKISESIALDIFENYEISFSKSPELTVKQLASIVREGGVPFTAKLLLASSAVVGMEHLGAGDPVLALTVTLAGGAGYCVILSALNRGADILRAAEKAAPRRVPQRLDDE